MFVASKVSKELVKLLRINREPERTDLTLAQKAGAVKLPIGV